MRIHSIGTTTLLALMLGVSGIPAQADSDNFRQSAETVRLSLGSDTHNKRIFSPSQILLQRGKSYRLVIDNPSMEVHEFDAPDLIAAVKSSHIKVAEYFGPGAPIIAKIVGTPKEIEIHPGGAIEWEFIPVTAGIYNMICDVKDKSGKTHTSMGMKGAIVVK